MTTVEPASAIDATMAVLRASSVVMESTSPAPRIHGGEIPKGRIAFMPEACIVVVPAGTPALSPGTRDNIPVSVRRIDVRCYGETPHQGDRVQQAVAYALKAVDRGVYERHLVYWYHLTSGPVQMTDPDGQWPVQIVTFNVMYADELVPA